MLPAPSSEVITSTTTSKAAILHTVQANAGRLLRSIKTSPASTPHQLTRSPSHTGFWSWLWHQAFPTQQEAGVPKAFRHRIKPAAYHSASHLHYPREPGTGQVVLMD